MDNWTVKRAAQRAVGFLPSSDGANHNDEIHDNTTGNGRMQPSFKLSEHEKVAKWIRRNVYKKDCYSFQENKKSSGYCMCGRTRKEHVEEALANPNTKPWNKNDEVFVRRHDTDAYGEIEFPNSNIAKYVRVADDTDMEDMMFLLTEIWGLQKPNLLISVTGGAKNIVMSKKLKDAFKKGLLKTAQTTGAWILTGGNNHGVMKYVGEAVNMLQSSTKVTAFGIAPWGTVMNKKELTHTNGCWPAYYLMRDEVDRSVNLDPNHTHYILVDDGTLRKFGTEITFRGLLEKHISEMTTGFDSSATKVPVVSIVVEGGPGTLTTVQAAIDNETPVVVLEGSGRAADMLAFAYNNAIEEDIETFDDKGKKKIDKIFHLTDDIRKKLRTKVEAEWPDKDADDLLQIIVHCAAKRHLIVVFSLTDNQSLSDIDVAILHAIMKANKDDAMNQLKLALAWNRIDIVRDEIFTEDKTWNGKDLEDILYTAMIQNKPDFVDLLTDYVHLPSFCTIKRLLSLYNSVPKNHLLHRLLLPYKDKDKETISLRDVGELTRDLIGDFYKPIYLRDDRYNNLNSDEILTVEKRPKSRGANRHRLVHQSTFAKLHEESSDSDGETNRELAAEGVGVGTAISVDVQRARSKNNSQVAPLIEKPKRMYDFDWPARELFLWCVMMRYGNMSMLFLQEEKYAIAPALMAAHLLRRMSTKAALDTETTDEILQMADKFETIAHGVISECFTSDEFKAKQLLIRTLPSYGETTILQLAVEAENKQFVSHQCCQNLLTDIWWGKMDELQGSWRVGLCLVCPLLVYALIKFKDPDELKAKKELKKKSHKKSKKKSDVEALNQMTATDRHNDQKITTVQAAGHDLDAEYADNEKEENSKISCIGQLAAFFNAPQVIFFYNMIFYLAFVCLYAFMMFNNHPDDTQYPKPEGIVVAVWVLTLLLEEFRQLWLSGNDSLSMKLADYFHSAWNVMDIIMISLFAVGYIIEVIDHKAIVDKYVADIYNTSLSLGVDNYDKKCYFDGDQAAYSQRELDIRYDSSRIILSLSLLLFILRIIQFFYFSRILGPKLVMIGRMLRDLGSFIGILLVFILAHGITQQAILFPHETPGPESLIGLFKRSYFELFGEFFFDDIEGKNECTYDKECIAVRDFLTLNGLNKTCLDGNKPLDIYGACADNSSYACHFGAKIPTGLPLTAFPDGNFIPCYNSSFEIPECLDHLDRCPRYNVMVLIILMLYLLFTQIMLFNLLIAMFSYTFQLVQENTDKHWMYQRYFWIKEFYTRPPAPPPLIVINHLMLFIRYIYRRCTGHLDLDDDFRLIMEEANEKQLANWERINFDEYNRKRKHDEDKSMENQVSKIKEESEELLGSVEGMRCVSTMNERINNIEKKLNDTSVALNWIMKTLHKGSDRPPLLKLSEDEEIARQKVIDEDKKKFEEWKIKKNNVVHIKCRSTHYMNSKVSRSAVDNAKLYWEIDWDQYRPNRYTAEEVINAVGKWADEDMDKMTKDERKRQFKFNQQDGNVCRISHHGSYKIDMEGYPLNPFGRTGLSGRGLLGQWGPNHALDAVISRWKRFTNGDFKMEKGKKVLEFISVKRKDIEEWSLTGKFVGRKLFAANNENLLSGAAVQAIKSKALNVISTENLDELNELLSKPVIIYEGYIDDPRNTDNAWIETKAFNFHDEDGISSKMELRAGPSVSMVSWLEASANLMLFAGHGIIVKALAEKHDSYY